MKIEARAKINLTLNVTGRRDNGYHDLELIFQPVSLCDTLYIEKKPDQSLAFSCSVKLFENEDNLVCKTYRAMAQRYPQIGGLSVFLKKRIPSGAGMAGGSTDAAAMIRALDQMYGSRKKKSQFLSARMSRPVFSHRPASGAASGRSLRRSIRILHIRFLC